MIVREKLMVKAHLYLCIVSIFRQKVPYSAGSTSVLTSFGSNLSIDLRTLAYQQIDERREGEEDRKNYCCIEEGLFQTSAGVETGAEVISTKCASKARSSTLQEYRTYQSYREDDLHIGQNGQNSHARSLAKLRSGVK